mmetsp:Transcript_150429/g.483465  ORF Transcript_150429/g.483465 Transcript_150429/m.483465 type:complete len:228 (-) Transcript_150429:13-696(-)
MAICGARLAIQMQGAPIGLGRFSVALDAGSAGSGAEPRTDGVRSSSMAQAGNALFEALPMAPVAPECRREPSRACGEPGGAGLDELFVGEGLRARHRKPCGGVVVRHRHSSRRQMGEDASSDTGDADADEAAAEKLPEAERDRERQTFFFAAAHCVSYSFYAIWSGGLLQLILATSSVLFLLLVLSREEDSNRILGPWSTGRNWPSLKEEPHPERRQSGGALISQYQ